MDRTTALGAAAGVTLAIVGGVSALFLTINNPADATQVGGATIVEYVDEYGNQIADPTVAAAPEIVLLNPDGTVVEIISTTPEPGDSAPSNQGSEPDGYGHDHDEYDEHEDEDYEENEYEEDEYHEDEHEDYDENEYDDHEDEGHEDEGQDDD